MSKGQKEHRDEIVIVREDPNSGLIPGFLLGALAGAVVGLLRAPGSGQQTRQNLTQTLKSRVGSAREAAQSRLLGRSSGDGDGAQSETDKVTFTTRS